MTPVRSDAAAPLRVAARDGLIGLVVLTLLAVVVSGLLVGAPGVWAALLGAAVGGGFVLFTVVAVLYTFTASINTMAAVLMGTWLLKVITLMAVLAVLARFTFYDTTTFGVVVLAAALGLLGLETRAVLRSRTPYVEPVSAGAPTSSTSGSDAS